MNFENRYDLHCHSTFSDGSLSPRELIDLALKKGLKGISITDHDTIDAYNEDTLTYAQQKGIVLIKGVEISTTFNGESTHVLCYGANNEIGELIQVVSNKRHKRNCDIIKFLAKKGLKLSLDEILGQTKGNNVGRPHIAHELVRKKMVKNFRQAFDLYLSDEKLSCIQNWSVTTIECVEVIKKAAGKSILAHPHLISSEKKIAQILDLGFDGLECYYANFRHDFIKKYLAIAKNQNLLVTGGSDFHGDFKPFVALAASYTSQADLDKFELGNIFAGLPR